MRNQKIALLVVLIILLVLLLSSTAFAIDERGDSGDVEYIVLETAKRPASKKTEEFGIEDSIFAWITADQFLQHGPAGVPLGTASLQGGYIGRQPGTGQFFTAGINLPTGVEIERISLYLFDNDPALNINLWYWRSNFDTRINEQITTLETSGAPGYTVLSFDPFPHHIHDNYHQYRIRLRLDDDTDKHLFAGARIEYKRRISPVPAVATFSDVPPTMIFFPFIEALAASKITVGYPDGTYRPNEPVTRGQMAAFLARALGLHHTDP